MRLLIITQKIDTNDPILGFFVRWVTEFAKHFEFITVIALEVGEYNLPKNVKVLSLEKELAEKGRFLRNEEGGNASSSSDRTGKGKRSFLEKNIYNKLLYIFHFYKYIWQERKNYDAVFMHMNQEYVILGFKFWKLFGKKIFLWRNHKKGNFLTRIAVFFSDKVFCTSSKSFTARFKKTKIMPVGVDTDFFKPDFSVSKIKNSILFLGRIDPVKNVDVFVEILKKLKDENIEFSATIAGKSSNNYVEYEKMVYDKMIKYDLSEKVKFTGVASQEKALDLYRKHELYVNLTESGSLDKTIFEAMACGSKILVVNTFFADKLPENSIIDFRNIEDAVYKIKFNFTNTIEHNFNVKEHSTQNLIQKLHNEINIHNI